MDALDAAYAAAPVPGVASAPVAAPADALDAAYASLGAKDTSAPAAAASTDHSGKMLDGLSAATRSPQLMADIDQVNRENTSPLAAAGDVIANLGTGLGSTIVGGYRGLATLATGGGLDAAADAVRSTQQDHTYQPRTGVGRIVTDAIGGVMGAAKYAGSEVGGAVGQGAGAIYDKAAGALGHDTHGAGSVQGRLAGEAIGDVAPDIYAALEGARAGVPRPISPIASEAGLRSAADAYTSRAGGVDYDVPAFVRKTQSPPPSSSVAPASASGIDLAPYLSDNNFMNSLSDQDRSNLRASHLDSQHPQAPDLVRQRALQNGAEIVGRNISPLADDAAATPTRNTPAEIAGDTSDIDAILKSVGVETPAKAAPAIAEAPPPATNAITAPTNFGRVAALEDTPESFQQAAIGKANDLAMQRHVEAQSLPVPVDLTEGQATGDIHKISFEQNARGKIPALADRFNRQGEALRENLDAIRSSVAPDIDASGVANDQALVDTIKNIDAPIRADIAAKYKALEDANGGQFPLNGKDFVDAADENLAKQNKGYFLPAEMKRLMEDYRTGGDMTYNDFESLRTILGNEQRKAARAGDGNTEHAINIVRSSLESLPMSDETATIKPLADAARQAAADRFIKINSDPAYKAAINDGVPAGESSPVADGFIGKYVVNGKTANVRNLVNNLSVEPAASQIVAAGVLDHLKAASGVDLRTNTGNISQAGLNKAINALGDKKGLVLDDKAAGQIDTLGNVARYTQQQPRGAYVNNSNTFVAGLAQKGAKAVEMGGNVIVPGLGLGTEAIKLLGRRADAKVAQRILGPAAGTSASTAGEIAAAAAKAERQASGSASSTVAPATKERPVLTIAPPVRPGIIAGALRPVVTMAPVGATQANDRK